MCFEPMFQSQLRFVAALSGFGFGLVYVPAIVAVGFYFEKKRSFAIGIAVCGTGAGTFLLSPINRILIDRYSWEGAFLIKAAIILNIIVCGMVMRPVEDTSTGETEGSAQLSDDGTSNKKPAGQSAPESAPPARPPMMAPPSIVIQDVDEKKPEERKMNKMGDSLPLIYGKEGENGELNKSNLTGGAAQIDVNEFARSMPMITFTSSKSALNSTQRDKVVSFRNSSLDIMAHVRSFQNIPIVIDTASSSSSSKDANASSALNHDGAHNESDQSQVCLDSPTSHSFISSIKNSIDFSLFTNSVFLLFAFSNFLTSLGFNAPFIYIIDQAIKQGISESKADWLLSTIGISNTFGRIILGYVSDHKRVNRLYLYGFVLTICGISTIIEPFLTTYLGLLVYSIVFGFTSGKKHFPKLPPLELIHQLKFFHSKGGYVSLTSVLIVDLLGLNNLTNAFGILLVFQGMATAIGPPTVGLLYDMFNSYEFPFGFTGAMIMFSGLMCFTIPKMKPEDA